MPGIDAIDSETFEVSSVSCRDGGSLDHRDRSDHAVLDRMCATRSGGASHQVSIGEGRFLSEGTDAVGKASSPLAKTCR